MEFKHQPAQTVAIIGGGPAGCTCAYYAQDNSNVTVFDLSSPLRTLLCTGGGRCNLAYEEYDFKELAKFYPRGEKFLYSIFSKFATGDTTELFNAIGVDTYTQDDLRIFPTSNSAKEVREKFLQALNKCKFKKEKVVDIVKKDDKFTVTTTNYQYVFDKVVISIGGHAGFSLAKDLEHNIISPKPALLGLATKANFKQIQGLSLKNITGKTSLATIKDDMIFTHQGISGPLAYKISSIYARENYNEKNPLKIRLNFCDALADNSDFQKMLDSNSKKDIKNLLSDLAPKSLAEYILSKNGIAPDTKCHQINGKTRDLIYKDLTDFEIDVVAPAREGEVVTSGGVDLKEINPKDMQSKLVKGLYFCGEVIDVDGFCGGFNLQNCWSTGFVAGENL